MPPNSNYERLSPPKSPREQLAEQTKNQLLSLQKGIESKLPTMPPEVQKKVSETMGKAFMLCNRIIQAHKSPQPNVDQLEKDEEQLEAVYQDAVDLVTTKIAPLDIRMAIQAKPNEGIAGRFQVLKDNVLAAFSTKGGTAMATGHLKTLEPFIGCLTVLEDGNPKDIYNEKKSFFGKDGRAFWLNPMRIEAAYTAIKNVRADSVMKTIDNALPGRPMETLLTSMEKALGQMTGFNDAGMKQYFRNAEKRTPSGAGDFSHMRLFGGILMSLIGAIGVIRGIKDGRLDPLALAYLAGAGWCFGFFEKQNMQHLVNPWMSEVLDKSGITGQEIDALRKLSKGQGSSGKLKTMLDKGFSRAEFLQLSGDKALTESVFKMPDDKRIMAIRQLIDGSDNKQNIIQGYVDARRNGRIPNPPATAGGQPTNRQLNI